MGLSVGAMQGHTFLEDSVASPSLLSLPDPALHFVVDQPDRMSAGSHQCLGLSLLLRSVEKFALDVVDFLYRGTNVQLGLQRLWSGQYFIYIVHSRCKRKDIVSGISCPSGSSTTVIPRAPRNLCRSTQRLASVPYPVNQAIVRLKVCQVLYKLFVEWSEVRILRI